MGSYRTTVPESERQVDRESMCVIFGCTIRKWVKGSEDYTDYKGATYAGRARARLQKTTRHEKATVRYRLDRAAARGARERRRRRGQDKYIDKYADHGCMSSTSGERNITS